MEDNTYTTSRESANQPQDEQKAQTQSSSSGDSSSLPPLPPDNYLVWAILSTVLCCWPFGIPAIVYSSKVDRYWASGYYDLAKDASAKAKRWAIISAVVAAGCWFLYFIVMMLLISLGLMAS